MVPAPDAAVECLWRALKRLGGALTAVCLAGCAGLSRPDHRPAAAAEARYEFAQPQMGLPFRMVVYATNATVASNATHAAFARIAQLNGLFSDYEEDSELTRLSRSAAQRTPVRVSDDLWRVLWLAQQMARRSEGAFDVTVGPVVQLWRRARRRREFPPPERLVEALASVGWHKLRLDARKRTAELLAPGMRLDLGGIAKGYALDAALRVLRTHGVRRALVAGGGDMAASNPPPGQRGWRIELAPLGVTNPPAPRFVLLAHAGLATSGDAFQRVILNGQRYSHIVDPRTGIGLTDHSLVTVIAPDATSADALATAVSVLGPEQGMKLVEATRRAAAYLQRQPGQTIEVRESRRLKRLLESPALIEPIHSPRRAAPVRHDAALRWPARMQSVQDTQPCLRP